MNMREFFLGYRRLRCLQGCYYQVVRTLVGGLGKRDPGVQAVEAQR